MKRLLMIAGTAALAFAGPGFAKPGNGHGNPHAYGNPQGGYGAKGCPPGLAKKAVPCIPPGQAKKIYGIGDRLPAGAFSSYSYNRIPYSVRNRYALSPHGTYYYGDGYIYRVDPRTLMVEQAIGALLHH